MSHGSGTMGAMSDTRDLFGDFLNITVHEDAKRTMSQAAYEGFQVTVRDTLQKNSPAPNPYAAGSEEHAEWEEGASEGARAVREYALRELLGE